MIKKYALIFLVFGFQMAWTQNNVNNKIDSLKSLLAKTNTDTTKVNLNNSLSIIYLTVNTSEGIKYGETALELAKKIKYQYGIAAAYKVISDNYWANSDFENAKQNLEQALNFSQNQLQKADILISYGLIYTSLDQYTLALEYYFKALAIYEEIKFEKGAIGAFSNIGNLYYYLKDYDKSIDYINKALVYNLKNGNTMETIRNYGNLGNAYTDKKDYNKGLSYYDKAITLCNEIGQDRSKMINLYSISSLYFQTKEFDKSIEYGKKSLEVSKKLNNSLGLLKNYGMIGDNYLEKYKLNKSNKQFLNAATENHKNSLELSKSLGIISEISANLNSISSEHELSGNYKQALSSYKEFVRLKDSIFNSENKESIKNLEDKRTIELKDKELEINKLIISQEQKQKYFSLIALSLLSLIGVLLYRQNKNRKIANLKLQALNADLEKANNTKTRFFNILNHDLRTPIANIIQFLHLQNESPDDLSPETKQRLQDKTTKGAENLLESMEDMLLWSKGQMENFAPQMEELEVQKLFSDISNHFGSEENISIIFENKENIKFKTDANYVKTIMRNLTGNAVKALKNRPNAEIIWKAWQSNGKSFLSITDNGTGVSQNDLKALYDETQVTGLKSGLGLHLIRDLSKAINCKVTLNQEHTNGAQFILEFQS